MNTEEPRQKAGYGYTGIWKVIFWLFNRAYLDLMCLVSVGWFLGGAGELVDGSYNAAAFGAFAFFVAPASVWSLVCSWYWPSEKRWALMACCLTAGVSLTVAERYIGFGEGVPSPVGICFAYASMLLGVYLFLKWKNEAKETD